MHKPEAHCLHFYCYGYHHIKHFSDPPPSTWSLCNSDFLTFVFLNLYLSNIWPVGVITYLSYSSDHTITIPILPKQRDMVAEVSFCLVRLINPAPKATVMQTFSPLKYSLVISVVHGLCSIGHVF